MERLYKDTATVQAFLMVVLFVSAGLPWRYNRNAFEAAGQGSTGMLVATLHFGMPLVAAAITFSRLLRGRVPEKASFWLVASQEILKSFAALLAAFALVQRGRFQAEVGAAVAGIVLLVGLSAAALVRGARREGWARWVHLLAMMTPWHVFVAVALTLEMGGKHPEKGPWLYLFSAASLLPLMAWALWPRKAEAAA